MTYVIEGYRLRKCLILSDANITNIHMRCNYNVALT